LTLVVRVGERSADVDSLGLDNVVVNFERQDVVVILLSFGCDPRDDNYLWRVDDRHPPI
jgi:hypothetical protein